MKNLALAGLVVAIGLSSFGCREAAVVGTPVDATKAPALLINRSWLDVMPRKKTDKLHVFRFMPAMGGGVYQDRTMFFGTFELFAFEATGTEIKFNLLHTDEKRTSRYRIERLPADDRRPDAPNLRLTIDDSPRGQASVYYSWTDDRAAVEARVLPSL